MAIGTSHTITQQPHAAEAGNRSEPSDSRAPDGGTRAPYRVPVLERLGAWRALTLQQSVGVPSP